MSGRRGVWFGLLGITARNAAGRRCLRCFLAIWAAMLVPQATVASDIVIDRNSQYRRELKPESRPDPRPPVVRRHLLEMPRDQQKVWFARGESFLTTDAAVALDAQVRVLLFHARAPAMIVGSCDPEEIETDSLWLKNQFEMSKLARRRAETVRDYLVARGVDGRRLHINVAAGRHRIKLPSGELASLGSYVGTYPMGWYE